MDRGWLCSGILEVNNKVHYGGLVRCECQAENDERLKQLHLMKYCRLPDTAIDITFDTFNLRPGLEQAYAKAQMLASGSGELQWLTLMGECDTGKSHLAMAVARCWMNRGDTVRYAAVPELLDDLRNAYNPGHEISYELEFNILKEAKLLILDDLGMESPTPWAQEKLDLIVELRSRSQKALLVTTNLPLNKLSMRIASRLQRFRPGDIVAIEAEEYTQYRGKGK